MVLGAVAGIAHLVWSVLVAAGVAQSWVDFVLRLHFVEPFYFVGDFSSGTAIVLILVTSLVGYFFGWVIGTVWNRVYKA